VTLGCSKNISDSQRIVELMTRAGYEYVAPWIQDCELVIVNSCAFTQEARQATEGTLRSRAAAVGKTRPKIVLTGCYVGFPAEPGKPARQPIGVDAAVPFARYLEIPAICDRLLGYEADRAADDDSPTNREAAISGGFDSFLKVMPQRDGSNTHSTFLKIGEGCSLRCSFCSIPSFRGPRRSRPIEDIVAEARHATERGVVELNLVSQETASYGRDLYGASRLPELLKALLAESSAQWIRLNYCYPTFVSERLIDLIAAEERLVPYFDIPLQHVNNRILRLMNRGYSRNLIEALLERILDRVPDAQIVSGFIAGFPGETEQEFQELVDFVGEGWFRYVNCFAYSREPGTASYDLDGQLEGEVKLSRTETLRQTQSRVFAARVAELQGREVVALSCGPNYDFRTRQRFPFRARSMWDAPEDSHIRVAAPQLPGGRIVKVRIVGSEGYVLHGEAV
jgi:ribosomal protein S12 methylthiotransferase